jgi:SGNH domain (fused to AT3 domains)
LKEIKDLAKPQPFEIELPDGLNASITYGTIPSEHNRTYADGRFNAVVVGDSFAGPMVGVLNEIAHGFNMSFLLSSNPTCAPFFDEQSFNVSTPFDNPPLPHGKRSWDCKMKVRPAMRELVARSDSPVVILNGNWVGTSQIWRAFKFNDTSLENTIDIIIDTLGRKVIVIGMVPGSLYNVPLCMIQEGKDRCPHTTPIKRLKSPPHTEESGKKQASRNYMRKVLTQIMKNVMEKRPGLVEYIDPYVYGRNLPFILYSRPLMFLRFRLPACQYFQISQHVQ